MAKQSRKKRRRDKRLPRHNFQARSPRDGATVNLSSKKDSPRQQVQKAAISISLAYQKQDIIQTLLIGGAIIAGFIVIIIINQQTGFLVSLGGRLLNAFNIGI